MTGIKMFDVRVVLVTSVHIVIVEIVQQEVSSFSVD
jgi:hypothetical protein